MFALSKLSGQLEVPSGTLGELQSPLRRPGQCAGTSGAEEFLNPLYGEPFFSRRFPLLVDYCGAFQNPLCSLESFCYFSSICYFHLFQLDFSKLEDLILGMIYSRDVTPFKKNDCFCFFFLSNLEKHIMGPGAGSFF